MNKIYRYILILLVPAFMMSGTNSVFAQNTVKPDSVKKPSGAIIKTDTVIENGKTIIYVTREAEKPVKIKKEKEEEPREIEYKGNIYRTKSAWINIGYGGVAYLKPLNYPYQNFGVGINIPVSGTYLKIAGSGSRIDEKTTYRNTSMMFGLGNRKQDLKYSFSYFFGLSYLFGHVEVLDTAGHSYYARVGGPGVFAETSIYYKPFYDIGIGSTAFINYDFNSPIIGIRLELYFSNAFKKKKPEY